MDMRKIPLVKLVLLFFVFLCMTIITGCDSEPSNTDAAVSDGITDNDLSSNRSEVLPNVTVYKMIDKNSNLFSRYLLSENVEGLGVVFCVRENESSQWQRLGDDVLFTDKNGRVTLPELRKRIPQNLLDKAPIDLQLQARIYFDKTTYISDDKGMVRVLSSDKSKNPKVIFTDHDNTIHATGGANSIQDWLDFLNFVKKDWPYVDDTVVDSFKLLRADKTDVIIVTGMHNDVRPLCREQMNLHFENSGKRYIPIIVKEDFPHEESNIFKKDAISVLKELYGKDNCLAMVGDTVRQDGYGAVSNDVLYVPFQINYELAPSLLDTVGYGSIDPEIIAKTWEEVLFDIKNGYQDESNYFLKRYRKILNIAHRGGGLLYPENTIEAYQNSVANGSDVIEADVHMTSDGVVVVSHDETVDRCTDGSGYIKEKELAEIKKLDAGYAYTTDDGATYPHAGKGIRIPTLRELFLDPVVGKKPLVLEIKQAGDEIVKKVLDLIEEFSMEDKIIIGGFNQETLEKISAEADKRGLNLVKIFATEGVVEFTSTPRLMMKDPSYKMPGDILCLPKHMMTTLLMDKARYLGLKVYVWTVNKEKDMERQAFTIRADGIMTDDPNLLESILNK